MSIEYLCCGDTLFDLFVQPNENLGKISLTGTVGGSPLNVALGLARLGMNTGYFAKNSNDLFGRRIGEFLASNRINTSHLISSDRNSTLAVIETNSEGVPDYAFYTSGTADRSIELHELPQDLPNTLKLIHVGSYTTATEPTASSLEALVSANSASRIISYDPNIRPSIEPDMDVWRSKVIAFSSKAHFVKASDEDLDVLYQNPDPQNFAQDCISRGAQLVCVTLGGDGAYAFSSDGRSLRIKGVPVSIKDTVGAGDTFQASCLYWLGTNNNANDKITADIDLEKLLEFAVCAAAITCSRRGADLPTLTEIEKALSK
ncbi:MAG: carbohydrate kinase family protein [Rhizobiaceae bacterium]